MGTKPSGVLFVGALVVASLAGCASTDLTSLLGQPPTFEAEERRAASKPPAAPVTTATIPATPAPHASAPVSTTKTALSEAYALYRAGQLKEAHALLSKAHAVNGGDRQVQIALGLFELDLGNPKAAEALLAPAAKATAPDWRVLSGLGVATSMLGRQAEAQWHLKKALQLSPGNPAVLNNLAISYMLDRKPGEAETMLKHASTTGKATPDMLENLTLARTLKAQMADAGGETLAP